MTAPTAQVQYPLTPERVQQAVSAYQNKMSLRDVAQHILHRGNDQTRDLLVEAGVTIRQRNGWEDKAPPRFTWREMGACRGVLYYGMSPVGAARAYSLSTERVRELLAHHCAEVM